MVILVLISILSLARSGYSEVSDQEALSQFNHFIKKYNRNYSESETSQRYSIFKSNLAHIQRTNNLDLGFSLEIGPNADKTEDELSTPSAPLSSQISLFSTDSLPTSVDWVGSGKVSALKIPSGSCTASWAFAAVDAIESIVAIKTNQTAQTLSTQQVISCSDSYGNSGCTSGLLNNTLTYALKNCLTTDANYPYTGKVTSCKRFIKCGSQITGFAAVTPNNEAQLKAAVAVQPVAVTINTSLNLQLYGGGIIPTNWCGTGTTYSNFLLVGYGSIAGNPFWILRSYWGSSWGISGYGLVSRNDTNTNSSGACGIASSPYVPYFNL